METRIRERRKELEEGRIREEGIHHEGMAREKNECF